MAKVTLTDLTSLANDTSATNSINTNFQTLEDYVNNNVLSRDTGAETNTMQNDLDMNSYDINNGGIGNFAQLTVAGAGVSAQVYNIGGVTQTWTTAQTASTYEATTSGNVTLDFGTYNHFIITLDGNITLDNPTTEIVGATGFICFKQDATGSRTLTLGSQYLTIGGAGITLSTGANAIDLVAYAVVGDGQILLGSGLLDFS